VHQPIADAEPIFHGTNHRLDPPRDVFVQPSRCYGPGETLTMSAKEAQENVLYGFVTVSDEEIKRLKDEHGWTFKRDPRHPYAYQSAPKVKGGARSKTS
jgi:hypothetical protein